VPPITISFKKHNRHFKCRLICPKGYKQKGTRGKQLPRVPFSRQLQQQKNLVFQKNCRSPYWQKRKKVI